MGYAERLHFTIYNVTFPSMQKLVHSPVDTVRFKGRQYFIKRDDLLDPAFSGNKARKLYYLLRKEYPNISKLISYGSPQSNSLYSLSALAKRKNWQLDFYVDHIPNFLKANPAGNYLGAILNGVNIIEKPSREMVGSIEEYIQQVILPEEPKSLYVPEGGHSGFAEEGVKLLASEIIAWAKERGIENLKIMLPSGTGTTALFLQKNSPFEVLTCACVGDASYLEKQFLELASDKSLHPTILPVAKKYHFGKMYDEFYRMWEQLTLETGVEFELLYDPLGWMSLLEYAEKGLGSGEEVLYIHQGGLLGNATMVARYKRAEKNRPIF